MEELYNDDVMKSVQQEGFVIDDDMKADWAVRRIASIEAETQRMLDFYKAQSEKLKEQCEQKTAFLKGLLQRYLMTVPTKETKTQSKYALPSGDLVMKKPAVAFRHDDEKLLKWLKDSDNGDLIAVKMSPAWAEIKKAITVVDGKAVFTDTGEIVDGVEPYMTEAELVIRSNKKGEDNK